MTSNPPPSSSCHDAVLLPEAEFFERKQTAARSPTLPTLSLQCADALSCHCPTDCCVGATSDWMLQITFIYNK